MRRAVGWISLVFVVLVFSSGCGAKRNVYIPPEWRAQPPPAQSSAFPSSSKAQTPPPAPSVSPSPILKPPPAITEKDVAVDSNSVAPPPVKKPAPPQQMASMHLVDQGKAALSQGKADAAISVLEQAIQVDVQNGEAFLQLARAWRMKAARNKSMEFARKAEILLHEDRAKLKEVYTLQADLYKEMGDMGKAEQYRKRASKL